MRVSPRLLLSILLLSACHDASHGSHEKSDTEVATDASDAATSQALDASDDVPSDAASAVTDASVDSASSDASARAEASVDASAHADDASAEASPIPNAGAGDASVAVRPDGGFAEPCEPGSGLLRVERDLCLGFDEAYQATAYASDLSTRSVIGGVTLSKAATPGAEWEGRLDPALLRGAPSCEAVGDHIFVIGVARDKAGNVVATCHEDRGRDTRYIGAVGGVLEACKGGLNIYAPAAAASTQLELFVWDGHSTSFGPGTLLTRMSDNPGATFRVAPNAERTCSSSMPPVYFVVAHDEGSSHVLGVYAFAHYN